MAPIRKGFLVGNGVARSDLMFVGDRPAILPDGRLDLFEPPVREMLGRMLKAMGRSFEDVSCLNVVQCACEGPLPDASPSACRQILWSAVRAVGPRIIVALGKTAAQTLLDVVTPITRLRGVWQECGGIRIMPTYHPAYLLKHQDEKRATWEDLQRVMAALKVPAGK